MSTVNFSQQSASLAAGLGRVDNLLEKVTGRISSGRRLDRPAADPAGLGQSVKLEAEQGRLRAAEVNIQNGVSRLQVTGDQLSAVGRLVTRLSELNTLGANSLQTGSDRSLYATEFAQLQQQLRQMVGGTTAEIGGTADVDQPQGRFNDRPLFGPGPADVLVVGSGDQDRVPLPVINLRSGAVGDLIRQDASGAFAVDLRSSDPSSLNATLKAALAQVTVAQADVGGGQSRLTLAAGVAATASANHEAALGAIVDADVAAETTELARLKILSEGHTAMLAQARDVTAKLLPLLSRG